MSLGSAAEATYMLNDDATSIRFSELTRRVESIERLQLERALGLIDRLQRDVDGMRLDQKSDNAMIHRRLDRNTQAVWGLMITMTLATVGLAANLIVQALG